MTGLLICAAVVAAVLGIALGAVAGKASERSDDRVMVRAGALGLAHAAAAIWLAYAAGTL